MTTITPNSAEFATFPKTIRTLITETIAVGGEVRYADGAGKNLLTFHYVRRYVSGNTALIQGAMVGWYVRDGRNKISSGVHDARECIARASRTARA